MLSDGEMATPVPRACCVSFSQRPILSEVRAIPEESGELVFFLAVFDRLPSRKIGDVSQVEAKDIGSQQGASEKSKGRAYSTWRM
jgi:hypothetical protein